MEIKSLRDISFKESYTLAQVGIHSLSDLQYFTPEYFVTQLGTASSINIDTIIKLYRHANESLSNSQISELRYIKESRELKIELHSDLIFESSNGNIRLHHFIDWEIENTLDLPYISKYSTTMYVYNKRTNGIEFIFIPSLLLLGKTHAISIPISHRAAFPRYEHEQAAYIKEHDPSNLWYVSLLDLCFTNLRKPILKCQRD